ncbi:MAG TPA: farnesyl diphosphate synthase [Candidatus Dormibacteraeota bacterium]|jgi:geranylgeranyl diphosphate synthase type II|nr:farnesyl diphosphate synthase [Candidatus Dormibacteraeota bacterium]
MSFDLGDYMKQRAAAVDAALDRFLPAESDRPESLHKAMRYSVFAGGKRLRPVLVIAGAEAVGGSAERVMPTACALELIHTYSLVHDDLPAMDNDDFRRGMPTNHKVFGEATAILAGDALLTLAFRLVADNARHVHAGALRDVILDIADAAGHDGMVAGQVADLEAEGKKVGADTVDYIHAHKTGALIRTSLRVGAMLCGADPSAVRALSVAGADLGLAFQIVDDILDVVSSSEELGKTAGKDQIQQKATYPAIHGIEASRARAAFLIGEADEALVPLGPCAEPIRALGRFILERKA